MVELQYLGGEITLVLRDLHGNTLQVFTHQRTDPTGPRRRLEEKRTERYAVTLGVQHACKLNEFSYLSYLKFRG
ncbi:MAG: hypothetical protein QW579_07190 [Desulfurococcaceae archaeon]